MIVKHTGNRLETIGWKQICEGLGENTSLTKLDLSREHAQNTFCFMNNLFFIESFAIENDIGLFGTLSDALRTNTTLIELRIWSLFNAFIEEKEYPFHSLFFLKLTESRIGGTEGMSLGEFIRPSKALRKLYF